MVRLQNRVVQDFIYIFWGRVSTKITKQSCIRLHLSILGYTQNNKLDKFHIATDYNLQLYKTSPLHSACKLRSEVHYKKTILFISQEREILVPIICQHEVLLDLHPLTEVQDTTQPTPFEVLLLLYILVVPNLFLLFVTKRN